VNAEQAREFVARQHRAVLATIRRDGRPQLSSVSYALDQDGRIKISVTRDRAKTRNLQRDPRATLEILDDDWHQNLLIDATVEVETGPTVLPDLRRVYQLITGGPHPDWSEFDAAMGRDQRCLLALTIERLYPLT